MGIGVSIFLIALGAILTWAVDWSVGGIDINVIGAILMVAGVGGLTLFFYFWNQRRVPEPVAAVRPRPADTVPRTYDDPTPPPAPAVRVVTPPQPPAPVTIAVPQPPPAPVTTVNATAPVVVSSQARPDGS